MIDIPRDYAGPRIVRLGDCADAHRRHSASPSQSSLSRPVGRVSTIAAKLPRGACDCCLGTGQQLLMRSWFIGDGFRRERCGICGGSGKSTYRDGAFSNWQRRNRKMEAAMKAAPKGLDHIALAKIAQASVQS